mgnify:CR=1 FL=1
MSGNTVAKPTALPDDIAAFTEGSGAALFDFPVSNRVVSPVLRHAHPLKERR